MILGPINSGVAAGGAGSATKNSDSRTPIYGSIRGIAIRYNDTPPSSTDVVVKTKGTNAPALTLLTLTNANADGWFFPRVQEHTTAGVAIADTYDWPPVGDFVNVEIAGANDGDSVDVWLDVSED